MHSPRVAAGGGCAVDRPCLRCKPKRLSAWRFVVCERFFSLESKGFVARLTWSELRFGCGWVGRG
eukprot:1663499-Pleurochrysis_carterae.AAC.1